MAWWWWSWAWSLTGIIILYIWNRQTHILSEPKRIRYPLLAVFVVIFALLGTLVLPRDTPMPTSPPKIIETHLDAWNVAWYDTHTNEITIDDRLHADPAVYDAVLAHEMRHYRRQDAFQDLFEWRLPLLALAKLKPVAATGVGGLIPFQTRPKFELDIVASVQLAALVTLLVLFVRERRRPHQKAAS